MDQEVQAASSREKDEGWQILQERKPPADLPPMAGDKQEQKCWNIWKEEEEEFGAKKLSNLEVLKIDLVLFVPPF